MVAFESSPWTETKAGSTEPVSKRAAAGLMIAHELRLCERLGTTTQPIDIEGLVSRMRLKRILGPDDSIDTAFPGLMDEIMHPPDGVIPLRPIDAESPSAA